MFKNKAIISKQIALVCLLLSAISICSAQGSLDDRREDMYLGAKVGLNFANVYDSKGEEFKADPKLGTVFGAFLSIPIGTYLGVQPEVLFSQKGFEGKGSLLGSEYAFKRTTKYLDIPLLVTLKPSPFLSILAGPQFSYLLSKKDDFTSDLVTIGQEEEFDNENYRKNTLGVALGVDININHFILGVRNNWDLQENNGDGTSTTPRYKNKWLQATVGYRF